MKNQTRVVKCLVATAALILIFAVVISFLPVNGEAEIYDNMIRLHVIANSDSEADQALKLKVRDAVLNVVEALPAARDKTEAENGIRSNARLIKESAEMTLRAEGCGDTVDVLFDTERYPERYYDGFALPAGEYTSLRVVIGDGGGHNWWCVLFPPLCRSASEGEREEDFIAAGFTPNEYKLIKSDSSPKYKVRFKILEILADVFGFDY